MKSTKRISNFFEWLLELPFIKDAIWFTEGKEFWANLKKVDDELLKGVVNILIFITTLYLVTFLVSYVIPLFIPFIK